MHFNAEADTDKRSGHQNFHSLLIKYLSSFERSIKYLCNDCEKTKEGSLTNTDLSDDDCGDCKDLDKDISKTSSSFVRSPLNCDSLNDEKQRNSMDDTNVALYHPRVHFISHLPCVLVLHLPLNKGSSKRSKRSSRTSSHYPIVASDELIFHRTQLNELLSQSEVLDYVEAEQPAFAVDKEVELLIKRYKLKSLVAHEGSSMNSGHYVSIVKGADICNEPNEVEIDQRFDSKKHQRLLELLETLSQEFNQDICEKGSLPKHFYKLMPSDQLSSKNLEDWFYVSDTSVTKCPSPFDNSFNTKVPAYALAFYELDP